jgi:hypothetical protein
MDDESNGIDDDPLDVHRIGELVYEDLDPQTYGSRGGHIYICRIYEAFFINIRYYFRLCIKFTQFKL